MHRYILEPYTGRASRHNCPNCNHRGHTFKRYIDTVTNAPLADHVGKCDRADNCGYHFKPRDYFAENPGTRSVGFNHPAPVKPFDTLPKKYVDDTTKDYWRNNFTQFLAQCVGMHTAITLADRYKIGTSKHWPGAAIFWQIDVSDRVRTGKIMLYNQTDGHRVKKPFNHITWAHTLLEKVHRPSTMDHGQNGFELKQCFFGEHLLHTDPFKTVAIAESEKTAVICSFFYPQYIWLASGSLEGLSWDKCKVLADRDVILYPDVNGYEKWRQKARELRLRLPEARFRVDDTLERTANWHERYQGIDIADRWIEQLLYKF